MLGTEVIMIENFDYCYFANKVFMSLTFELKEYLRAKIHFFGSNLTNTEKLILIS